MEERIFVENLEVASSLARSSNGTINLKDIESPSEQKLKTLCSFVPRMVLDYLLFEKSQSNKELFQKLKLAKSLEFNSTPSDCVETQQFKRRFIIDDQKIRSFDAAILMVDIKGFTALNEEYANKGTDGIEEITKYVNGYFQKLIELILNHKGDILKFAGDALIVAFGGPYERTSLKIITLAAIECALEIEEKLKTYTVSNTLELSLHLAIGAGTLFALHLGGIDGQKEFFPAGNIFKQMALPLSLSDSGSVYLSKEAYSIVSANCECIQNHDCWRVLKVTKPIPFENRLTPKIHKKYENHVRAYVAKVIQEKIDFGLSNWIGEMRKIAAMFVQLRGLVIESDSIDSIDYNELNIILQMIQKTIFRYGGFLRQFLLEEKGCTLICIFGAPISSEHDVIRAVTTALSIAKQLKLLNSNYDCSIGITYGNAFCGCVGLPFHRQEYAVVGDIVNLSARLMTAASQKERGTCIYCDKATKEKAKSYFEFRQLPSIFVKGKSDPIPIYRPSEGGSPRTRGINQSHQVINKTKNKQKTIGRDREKDLIFGYIKSLTTSPGITILIQGEAGIGKTTLAEEAISYAGTLLGGGVYLGTADSLEKQAPFFALQPVFQQLLHLSLDNPEENSKIFLEKLNKIENKQIRESCLASTWCLKSLFLTNFQAKDEILSFKPKVEKQKEILVEIMKVCVKEKPRVILIEDVQWLDTSSWELLAQIVDLNSLLVLLTTRPIKPNSFVDSFLMKSNILSISLKPLSQQEILKILCLQLQCHSIDQTIIEKIFTVSHGNPLFAKELMNNSIALLKREGTNVTGDITQVEFPDNLKGILLSRFDRLTEEEKMILKVASVLGKIFNCEILSHVYPNEFQTLHALDEKLNKLDQQGFLLTKNREGTHSHEFRCTLFKEVIYKGMVKEYRIKLHQKIVEYYQTYRPDQENIINYHKEKTKNSKELFSLTQVSGVSNKESKEISKTEERTQNCYDKYYDLCRIGHFI